MKKHLFLWLCAVMAFMSMSVYAGPFISVTDHSISDWNNLPSNYVFETVCPDDAAFTGLKSAKVFANEQYIYILVEPNMADLPDLEWVPFHLLIDTDDSDSTGGYGDVFTDANTDIIMEGALFANGSPYTYAPYVYQWWGAVGGDGWYWYDPSVEHDAYDCWGALVCEGELAGCTSQYVNGKFEIQIERAQIPVYWDERRFGIGFDIQQSWSNVGLLPIASPTDANPSGRAAKMKVNIYHNPGNPLDHVPSDSILAAYTSPNEVCVCIYVPEELACNRFVLTGSFNNWSSDPYYCSAFSPVEGYEGWYVTSVAPDEEPDPARGIQAKPIMLGEGGDFNWEYQVGAASYVRGGAEIVEGGYAGEIDIINYSVGTPNVYIVDAWRNNPCTAVYHNYTLTVVSDGCDNMVVPFLTGAMNNWQFQQMLLDVEASQANGAPTYSLSFRAPEGTEYQILSGVMSPTDGSIEIEPAWEDSAFLYKAVNNMWVRYPGENGTNLVTHEDENIVFDLRDADLCWARCAGEVPPIDYSSARVFWPVMMSQSDIDMHASSMVASFCPNEYDQFLYVWENTYSVNYADGALDMTVGNEGWAGSGFYLSESSNNLSAAQSLLENIKAHPEYFYLHLSVKAYDNYAHAFRLFDIDGTTFTLGQNAVYDAPVYGDFDRDGQWHELDIPMTYFADAMSNASVSESGANIFIILSEGVAGAHVELKDIYFYTNESPVAARTMHLDIHNNTSWNNLYLYAEATDGSSYYQVGDDYPGRNITGEASVELSTSLPDGTVVYLYFHDGLFNTYSYIALPLSDSAYNLVVTDYDVHFWTIEDAVIEDGLLEYRITGLNPHTVAVVGHHISDSVHLVIPESIVFEGEEFTVTAISESALAYCGNLLSVVVPNSVLKIGNEAFFDCVSLREVTIGENVFDFAYNAFNLCYNITAVHWNAREIGNQYDTPNFGSNVETLTFGENVEVIPYSFCNQMYKLRELEIPASVWKIMGQALYCGSSEEYGNSNNLRKIVIHSTYIENYDRYNGSGSGIMLNANLDTVIAPACVFGDDSYYYYSASPYIAKNIKYLRITAGELTDENNMLKYIRLSGKSLQTLDAGHAYNTVLPDMAFSGFYNLTSLTLPAYLETIGYMAVAGCKSLTAITIPASVRTIEASAFEDCRSLASVTFGMPGDTAEVALETIGKWAFYNNHALTEIAIPAGVTEIGDGAFYGCAYMENVSMPASMQRLGDNAFALCQRMNSMVVNAVVPPVAQSRTFDGVNRNIPVYVPDESVNEYKTAQFWKEFFILPVSRIESGIDNTVSETRAAKVLENGQILIRRGDKTYTLHGQTVK